MGARGCGSSRQVGGVYLVTKLSTKGTPLDMFLIDPPLPVPDGFDLPARGVTLRERPDGSGVWDVYDHVGVAHYPNVADFVEEVRNMGLSRHISRKTDFAKLTKESVIFLAHSRAVITNHDAYYDAIINEAEAYPDRIMFSCPKCVKQHAYLPEINTPDDPIGYERTICAGLWWHDITGGDDLYDPTSPPRTVRRTVGDTVYLGRKRPEGVTPKYERGFFLGLPLSCIEVVEGRDAGKGIESASRSGLPVSLEQE